METTEMHDTLTGHPSGKDGKPTKVQEAKGKPEEESKSGAIKPKFGSGSFSTYYTWRGNGTINLNCGNSAIRANSRVVASISEYNTDPALNRFVGNAYMLVYNVAPYNGGVIVRLNVGWNSPLNVRVDLLIDP